MVDVNTLNLRAGRQPPRGYAHCLGRCVVGILQDKETCHTEAKSRELGNFPSRSTRSELCQVQITLPKVTMFIILQSLESHSVSKHKSFIVLT